MIPEDCLFTEQHEWIRVEGDSAVVGITQYAADQLGDVTYVEVPEEGADLTRGGVLGTVESVKAVSEIFAPAGGTVTAVNEQLEDEPGIVNEDPYGDGWICEMTLTDKRELERLLDAAAYSELIENL